MSPKPGYASSLLCSSPRCEKCLDGLHRLGLLFLGRNLGRQVPLLRPIVTELGVIAAVDHHDIVGIIDLFRHAAVERSIDR